uniref:uncharacterized protein YxbB-like n=1 Tax=Styela clava TaxID=7725 RepID=UPI001939279A|nr:uncharacterized protein YxbB-like [Styela clava]
MVIGAKYISSQMRKPTKGIWGFIARRRILKHNLHLEESTYRALAATPDQNILELGFGLGYGLNIALKNIATKGKGTVFGVDYSSDICNDAKKSFKNYISKGKLIILNEDVAQMSLHNNSIDGVFHTNCFYFWPDIIASLNEIQRVMKPGGVMVAGMNLGSLNKRVKDGLLQKWQIDPERYCSALEMSGFEDITQEDIYNEILQKYLRIIKSSKPK